MEFKDKLRNLRTEAGLSQEALADIVHVSRSAIAKYENGGVIYIYDLGYYKDYIDPTTFEITFNQNNNIVFYEVVPH